MTRFSTFLEVDASYFGPILSECHAKVGYNNEHFPWWSMGGKREVVNL
jgi:hypothetical protein